jgi:hypothetical protein
MIGFTPANKNAIKEIMNRGLGDVDTSPQEATVTTTFRIGDEIEYSVRAKPGKIIRGRIAIIQPGGKMAQVTDPALKPEHQLQSVYWCVDLEKARKI